jgi:hemoglobin
MSESNEQEDARRKETVRIGGVDGQKVGGNFYEQVGGKPVFEKLAAEFYKGIATDEVLRPMYPEGDLAPAAERLQLFLEQYWGGPTTYQELRGHPRLRMRHSPYKINPLARDRWLLHMRAAVDSLALPPLRDAELWAYLERAATSMLNTFED